MTAILIVCIFAVVVLTLAFCFEVILGTGSGDAAFGIAFMDLIFLCAALWICTR